MAVDTGWLAAKFPNLEDFEPLGVGGQKEVFRACDKLTGEVVVLKLFHANANTERAVRELNAVAGFNGHRVPKVLDVGTAVSPVGNHVWFIEQFVEGETLEDVLKRGKPAQGVVRKWVEQLLATLVVAGEAGVVHRDIKPANIIIDASGDAWLIDFGIARHLGLLSVTSTSAVVGPHSPGYAPPEQFTYAKRDIDSRADLFALGVVTYECLEGRNPFTDGATSAGDVLSRVTADDLPRVSEGPGVSSSFADMVQSMTRRSLSQRPPTASYAVEWLRES